MKTSNTYRIYVLCTLMTVYLFSVMDRQIMSILMEDIKDEFNLTDLQMGMLAGLAFTLFYATLGLPVARLADRYSRKVIVAIAITIWSAATVASGMAVGFVTLFLARVGVGIGEAGGGAPSHSLISDYFRKEELSRALAIFSLGAPLGVAAGLLGGGWFADTFGWRNSFMILGVPGILIGLIVFLTVREPQRTAHESNEADQGKQPIGKTIKSLWSNRPFQGALWGHACAVTVAYAIMIWMAPLMIRNFAITKTEVGVAFGLAVVIAMVPGMILGGLLSDRLVKMRDSYPAYMSGIALLLCLPFLLLSFSAQEMTTQMIYLGIGLGIFNLSHAPAFAIVQSHVKPAERALASALVFFASNMLGHALGPPIIGLISDFAAADDPSRSLNTALYMVSFMAVPAALFFFWTGRSIDRKALALRAAENA